MTRPRSIHWIILGGLAALLAGAAGCGSGRTLGGAAAGETVTLARDVQPIFTANCAFSGCHAGSAPQLDLDLSEGRAHAHIVNVPSVEVEGLMRVLPGDSANSYLFQKISQENPAVGSRMPLGGSLSAAQIDTIRRWIDGGALP